jgi:hypothetical protein
MVYTVPYDVITGLEAAAREGQTGKREGIIAALGSGTTEPVDCPGGLMPRWLAALIAGLDESIGNELTHRTETSNETY